MDVSWCGLAYVVSVVIMLSDFVPPLAWVKFDFLYGYIIFYYMHASQVVSQL